MLGTAMQYKNAAVTPEPPTSAVAKQRKQAGKHTPWLQIVKQLLQKVTRKKKNNGATWPFQPLVQQARKNLKFSEKPCGRSGCHRDRDPTSHCKPTQRESKLAISTTRSSVSFKRKASQTHSKMPQISPQRRGRAGLTPVSQPTPPPPQPRQNPPLARDVAVDLPRAPGTSHICAREGAREAE